MNQSSTALTAPASPKTELEKRQLKRELNKAVGTSEELLVSATTVFPFTFFPDTFTLDRTKATITHRQFFKVADVMSIRIEDILNVAANVGPIFGSIKILTRFFDPGKPYTVNFFWRQDALKIKRIMQGYLIALQKEIDCSALSTGELSKLLDDLGKVAPEAKV